MVYRFNQPNAILNPELVERPNGLVPPRGAMEEGWQFRPHELQRSPIAVTASTSAYPTGSSRA